MDKKLTNKVIKYKVKINKLEITNDFFIIISDDGTNFVSSIKKGSVDFIILNESKQEVNLGSLEENDLITIVGVSNKKSNNNLVNNLENKNLENKDEKNIIIIKKIYVKNNYTFNSNSSEEISDYE